MRTVFETTISKELLLSSCAETGLELTPPAVERFDAYARLLAEYNERVNLTAVTRPDEVVTKHFADSLSIFRFVELKAGTVVCDVGTGAGFPGCALLCAMPELKLTLMDSVNKKLDFLRFLTRELGLEAEIVCARAEDAAAKETFREKFDVVTSRAVAQLRILSELCVPLVRIGGVFAPLKARLSEEEKRTGFSAAAVLGCKTAGDFLYNVPLAGEREIAVFKKTAYTPTKYPRRYSQISKKPL